MSKQELKELEEFEDLANGIYVESSLGVRLPSYNFKKLNAYCRKKGIKQPADLTEEERDQFLVKN